jgi:hypothetical protein
VAHELQRRSKHLRRLGSRKSASISLSLAIRSPTAPKSAYIVPLRTSVQSSTGTRRRRASSRQGASRRSWAWMVGAGGKRGRIGYGGGLRRAMSLLLDDGTCGFMTVWGTWQHGLLGAGMAWHGGLAHSECIRVPTAVRVRMVHQSLGPGSLPWIRASRPIMVHPRRKDDRGRLGTTIGRWIVGSVSVCFRPPSRPPDLEFIPILVIHVSPGLGSMPQSNRTPYSLFSIMPLRVLVLNVCSSSSETWTRHAIIQNFLPLVSELHPETGSQHIFPLP